MLHPINIPDCLDHLWLIVSIQEELLQLSCSEDPTDAAVLHRHFEPAVVSWLWTLMQKLLDPLKAFYEHPNQAEKLAIVDAFQHDITYHDHLEDASFTFLLQPKLQMPSHLASSAGEWLQNFYYKVMHRVPAAVVDYSQDMSSQLIYRDFIDINTEMGVCPACDGSWMERTSSGIKGSIDHFLPRAKYPALSVHPSNLIPVCEACNHDIKAGKDPLCDNQPRTLADVFTYCPGCTPSRPARDTLVIQVGASASHPWLLQCQRATAVQLSLFPDIYDLPGRWQQRADQLDRIVRSRLRDCLQLRREAAAPLSRNTLHAVLNDLERRMRKEWGESAHLYPATWWLRWLHQNKFDDLAQEFV